MKPLVQRVLSIYVTPDAHDASARFELHVRGAQMCEPVPLHEFMVVLREYLKDIPTEYHEDPDDD